ncbi:MAG: hypothetical protein KDB16_00195 [Acidimicrobiales bacterium]|nr:hypothetical protein [Acidimicrobiales bacterium]
MLQHSKKLILVLVSILALAGLTACGDDGLEPDTYAVTAVDYGFEGLPDKAAVGSTLTMTNASSMEVHELVAIRLPDDETRSGSELMALPMNELMAFAGGVETVIVAPPDTEGFAVEGTGELTQAGRYLILCGIPTGADPAEYMAAAQASQGGPVEVEGGAPHFVNGMWGEIEVVD